MKYHAIIAPESIALRNSTQPNSTQPNSTQLAGDACVHTSSSARPSAITHKPSALHPDIAEVALDVLLLEDIAGARDVGKAHVLSEQGKGGRGLVHRPVLLLLARSGEATAGRQQVGHVQHGQRRCRAQELFQTPRQSRRHVGVVHVEVLPPRVRLTTMRRNHRPVPRLIRQNPQDVLHIADVQDLVRLRVVHVLEVV
eukprot:CAMPEP_0198127578 /NCGR_PEP_ID=MMETSP1442-20131203/47537_1 /TAXON_ID= /ORGANISM="Craspedostauros australis, Strain CCMP3328" /LENGTH=197 /DNA_ID=CAMNT_0043787573 /DNA_START=74 /DNA_END=663 /DNA_ORIENTATION=+